MRAGVTSHRGLTRCSPSTASTASTPPQPSGAPSNWPISPRTAWSAFRPGPSPCTRRARCSPTSAVSPLRAEYETRPAHSTTSPGNFPTTNGPAPDPNVADAYALGWVIHASTHRLEEGVRGRPRPRRSPSSARTTDRAVMQQLPRIAAGLRAFSPSFPLTQRHAVYVHNLEADLRPIRRYWVGRGSLQVAGSRSSSRKHPATGRPHRAGADVRYAACECVWPVVIERPHGEDCGFR